MVFCLSVGIFLIGFLIFSSLFQNIIIVSLLSYQLSILGNSILNLLKSKMEREIELNKIEKIEKSDKEKLKYFRDILKEYSIGELGYLFNESHNLKLLIGADLMNLKRQKKIKIEENSIVVLDKTNLSNAEEYLVEKYKFLDNYQFEQHYLDKIQISLEEKGCIQKYQKEISSSLVIGWFLNFVSFFILFNASSIFKMQNSFFLNIEVLLGGITVLTLALMIVFMTNAEAKKFTKTVKGKEIYLKLCGLKNFMKDFSNFEEKSLNEMMIWDEYILYAIVLNESQNLTEELKNDINKIIEKMKITDDTVQEREFF